MSASMSEQEQAMLRDAVRAFLGARADRSWASLMHDLGLGATLLDPEQGAIVAEEIGRACAPLPYAGVAAARWLLDRCGVESPDDNAIIALGWAEPSMRYDLADIALEARPDGAGWQLDGTKAIVGWAPDCTDLLVVARTDASRGESAGLSLFRLDPATTGLSMAAYRMIDGQPAADLTFAQCRIDEGALIGPRGEALVLLEEARDRAMALLAAEAVGLLDSLLAQTIDYTGQRRQFGQPIAGFQALQHRMVDMYLECELARSSAWLAIEALAEPAPDRARARAVSCAMVNVGRASRFIGQQAIQLHGGMGMTDELPVGHYVKRAMAIEVEWADADWHLARIADL